MTFTAVEVAAFLVPQVLAGAAKMPGVPEVKAERLRSLAESALDGARLRVDGLQDRLAWLQDLPGIGFFSAELTLLRVAGEPDYFPRTECRLYTAMGPAYHVDPADTTVLAGTADGWRPFRSWISFLFRAREPPITFARPVDAGLAN